MAAFPNPPALPGTGQPIGPVIRAALRSPLDGPARLRAVERVTEKRSPLSIPEKSLRCTPAAELKLWRKSKEPYVVPNLRR